MTHGVRHKIDKGTTYKMPFNIAAARETIYGVDQIIKFGRSTVIGATEVDVSDFGDLIYLDTAEKLNISSTSAEDAVGGTGATAIHIYGLDADYNEIEETIIPTGLTPKETEKAYLRVYRMRAIAAGDTEGAVGVISLKDSLTNVQAQILSTNNVTLMSHYTIPAGKTGHVLYSDASCSAGKSVTVKYKLRPIGGIFQIGQTIDLFENNYLRTFVVPGEIPEKADIKVQAISSASGTSVSINYELLLIDDEV